MSTDYFKPNENKLLQTKDWLDLALSKGDLTLIRLDLYIPANFKYTIHWTEDDFISFCTKFIRSVNRSKLLIEEAYVGGIFSKEWAPRSSWHCHCLLTFRKRKVKNAWPLAEHVEELWCREVERIDEGPLNFRSYIQQLRSPNDYPTFHLSTTNPLDQRREWKKSGHHASLYRCLSYLSKPNSYSGLSRRETTTRQKGTWYYLPYSEPTATLIRNVNLAKTRGEDCLEDAIYLELKKSVDHYTHSWTAVKQLYKPAQLSIPVCFWYELGSFEDWLTLFEVTEPRPEFGEVRLIAGKWYCLLIYRDRKSLYHPVIDYSGLDYLQYLTATGYPHPLNFTPTSKKDWLLINRLYTGSLVCQRYDYQYHSDPYPRSRC